MNSIHQPLVSVMIPVYQAENTIEKCLDSILSQTYKRIEILAVDDGSTDNTKNILRKYAGKDNRIRAKFYDENRGQSAVRNEMIRWARGEFFCFVDSDDYVDEKFIEELFDSITRNNTDISVCNYYSVSDIGEINAIDLRYRGVLEQKAFCEEIIADRCPSFLWNKMFKPYLFHDNYLKEGIVWEDLEWFGRTAILLRGGVSFVEEPLYYYVMNSDSTVHKRERLAYKAGCIAYAFCQRYRLALQLKNTHLMDIALGEMLSRILSYEVYKKYCNDTFLKEYDLEISVILREITIIKVLKNRTMNIYRKIQFLLFRGNKTLFMFLSKKRIGI